MYQAGDHMSETQPLTVEQKRAQIATYVESMTEVIPREGELTAIIESALAHNILDRTVSIPDELVLQWYAALFGESTEDSQTSTD